MIFSVVIPVYNVKDYLPKCIDSVLAQDFEDYEVILIDDGSTDGESGAICDRYAAAHPERIRAIHKPNGGVGEARNVGIEAAQGEYLIFIDSDDYIATGMFRVLADAIARFGSDIIGFGAALEADGVVVKELVDPLPTDRTFTLADTPELMQTMPSPWSRIWRRSLFLDSGVRYPARIWYEDLCTSVKLLALARSAAFVPDILYYYVDRTNSITRNTNTARNAELFTAFDNLGSAGTVKTACSSATTMSCRGWPWIMCCWQPRCACCAWIRRANCSTGFRTMCRHSSRTTWKTRTCRRSRAATS